MPGDHELWLLEDRVAPRYSLFVGSFLNEALVIVDVGTTRGVCEFGVHTVCTALQGESQMKLQ